MVSQGLRGIAKEGQEAPVRARVVVAHKVRGKARAGPGLVLVGRDRGDRAAQAVRLKMKVVHSVLRSSNSIWQSFDQPQPHGKNRPMGLFV